MEPEGYHPNDPSVGHFFPTRNIAIPLSGSRFRSEDRWVTAHDLNLTAAKKNARRGELLSTTKEPAFITSLILRAIFLSTHVDKLGDCGRAGRNAGFFTLCYRPVKIFRGHI